MISCRQIGCTSTCSYCHYEFWPQLNVARYKFYERNHYDSEFRLVIRPQGGYCEIDYEPLDPKEDDVQKYLKERQWMTDFLDYVEAAWVADELAPDRDINPVK